MHRSSIAAAVVGVSTIALTQIASAADQNPPVHDVPIYKVPPPPPAPVYNWTGFYAGLNAGDGWGTSEATTTSAPLADDVAQFFMPSNSLGITDASSQLAFGSTALANSGSTRVNQRGFIGGGQIGYNFQVRPTVVLGIEADIQGAGIRGSGSHSGVSSDTFAAGGLTFSASTIGPNSSEALQAAWSNAVLSRSAFGLDQVSANIDWLSTVRGRAGYLITPSFLVYATGGLASGGVKASVGHSLDTNYNFTADGFALAYAQAAGTLPIATVSATAAPGNLIADATASTTTVFAMTHASVTTGGGPSAAAIALGNFDSSMVTATTKTTAVASATATSLPVGSASAFSNAVLAPQPAATSMISQTMARFSETRFGGTFGGGFEWKLAPNMSVKVEGLYYNLGTSTITTAPLTSSVAPIPAAAFNTADSNVNASISKFVGTSTTSNVQVTRIRLDGVILRAGINYQFDWGAWGG